MLQVGLADLEQGPVETAGTIAADDPLFEGLDFRLVEPVDVAGQLSAAGAGSYYWRGDLKTAIGTVCRRCLNDVSVPVRAAVDILFTEDQSADDPSVYVIPPRALAIDLAPAVREELILAVPAFALCREDCRGLCPRCGRDLNSGPCECDPDAPDPRWAGLSDLKQRLENER
jgi:uncharacterized protein